MMLPCKECQSLISEKAVKCPKCGVGCSFSAESVAQYKTYFSFSLPTSLRICHDVHFRHFAGIVKELFEREEVITEGLNANIFSRVQGTQKMWIDNPTRKTDHYFVLSNERIPIKNGLPVSCIYGRSCSGDPEEVIVVIDLTTGRYWVREDALSQRFSFFQYPGYFRNTLILWVLALFMIGLLIKITPIFIPLFVLALGGLVAYAGYFSFCSQAVSTKKADLLHHTETIVTAFVNAFKNQQNPGPNDDQDEKTDVINFPPAAGTSMIAQAGLVLGTILPLAFAGLLVGMIVIQIPSQYKNPVPFEGFRQPPIRSYPFSPPSTVTAPQVQRQVSSCIDRRLALESLISLWQVQNGNLKIRKNCFANIDRDGTFDWLGQKVMISDLAKDRQMFICPKAQQEHGDSWTGSSYRYYHTDNTGQWIPGSHDYNGCTGVVCIYETGKNGKSDTCETNMGGATQISSPTLKMKSNFATEDNVISNTPNFFSAKQPHTQESNRFNLQASKEIKRYLDSMQNKSELVEYMRELETKYNEGTVLKAGEELRLKIPADSIRYMDFSLPDGTKFRAGYVVFPKKKAVGVFSVGRPDSDFDRKAKWELKVFLSSMKLLH